jgi:hypothetical protein
MRFAEVAGEVGVRQEFVGSKRLWKRVEKGRGQRLEVWD